MSSPIIIEVPASCAVALKRLQAGAGKEAAPKIGPYRMISDGTHYCRIDYAYACALVTLLNGKTGDQSKAVIVIERSVLKSKRAAAFYLALFLGLCVTLLLLSAFVFKSNHVWDWASYLPFICPLMLYFLMVPFSKHVLRRFIESRLLTEAEQ